MMASAPHAPDRTEDVARGDNTPRRRPALAALAVLLDLVLVVLFVALGRDQHATDDGPWGLLRTASPFLLALLVMTAVTAGQRTWARLWPHGVLVWLGTVALGMILRVWWGLGGAPLAFVLVATGVLGVFLLGRRLASRPLLARTAGRP